MNPLLTLTNHAGHHRHSPTASAAVHLVDAGERIAELEQKVRHLTANLTSALLVIEQSRADYRQLDAVLAAVGGDRDRYLHERDEAVARAVIAERQRDEFAVDIQRLTVENRGYRSAVEQVRAIRLGEPDIPGGNDAAVANGETA